MPKATEKNNNWKKILFFISLVFAVFILDRYTKYISSFKEVCFILCIKQSKNFGAAFNLLSNFAWTRIFLIVIALIILFLTAFFYFKTKKLMLVNIGLALLFTGTLSNVFDRIFFGYVIDFITFSFFPRFPAFNIADISNLAGIIILIWALIKK